MAQDNTQVNNETDIEVTDNKDGVIDETNTSDETKNTEEQTVETKIPYNRFKAKVDEANALKEKLAEIERQQQAEATEKLESQNEYKTLYEQALETIKANKADALNATKTSKLVQAGYDEGQIEVLRNTIAGETDEEITQAVEAVTSVIPPKKSYIDPTPMGGGDGKPGPVDKEEVGRSAISKVLHKIKL